TDGSNPLPSSEESANFWSPLGQEARPAAPAAIVGHQRVPQPLDRSPADKPTSTSLMGTCALRRCRTSCVRSLVIIPDLPRFSVMVCDRAHAIAPARTGQMEKPK